MNTKAVMAAIAYRAGVLWPVLDEGEDPFHISCQVIKEDRGRLLVRVEEGSNSLPPETDVELEVPTDRALYRLFSWVERSVQTSEATYIVYLVVDEIETIQRRKQERFDVSFPLKFVPMKKDEKLSATVSRPYGLGRVTNISISGLQFEAEYDLPVGLRVRLEVRLPNGHLDLNGEIVKVRKDKSGANVYGVKLSRMDTVTSQRMNRLILQFERRKRQERESSRVGGRSSIRRGFREARGSMERWSSREARRRRR